MKLSESFGCLALLAVLTAPLAGCGGASTPDKGPTGPATGPVTPDMVKSVEAGRGQMGPASARKK